MNIEIVFYQSPLGVLEIRSTGNAISDVLFLNSWKGNKINEGKKILRTRHKQFNKKSNHEKNSTHCFYIRAFIRNKGATNYFIRKF